MGCSRDLRRWDLGPRVDEPLGEVARICRSGARVALSGHSVGVTRWDGRRRGAVFVALIVMVLVFALVFYAGERSANRKDCLAVTGHHPDLVSADMVRC